MRYIDYLKLQIEISVQIYSLIIVIYGIMRFLGLIDPIYISVGTIMGKIVMPMFFLAFFMWRKQYPLL